MTDGGCISIRPYVPGDAAALHAAVVESASDAHRWLPWCRPGYTFEEARGWVERQVENFEVGEELHFAVVDGDAYLGGCGLSRIDPLHRIANLGYWVRTAAVGRGVATSAVRALVRYAFAETALERLEVLCALDNVASQRVAERAGAVREGVLRKRLYLHGEAQDAVVYSLVRPDDS